MCHEGERRRDKQGEGGWSQGACGSSVLGRADREARLEDVVRVDRFLDRAEAVVARAAHLCGRERAQTTVAATRRSKSLLAFAGLLDETRSFEG